ncbi:hypothetical protein EHRUM3_05110 [Ehrlichia ruminantium]|uniref:Uncharacterized protein n=1 Tax=Ehrlichia ruminantium TaxID=779 RepID=A0A170SS89_EHRRU|nr:hypothetical protein [Ehrlichia ruminantium]GAT78294.1 hypothetical protein EHRUM3_05110 [Ehrlichia ruminantium]
MIVSRSNGIKVACIVAVASSLIIVQVLKSMGIIKDNESEILSIVISVILITGIAAVLFQCMCTNSIKLEILDTLSESDSHVPDGDIDTLDTSEVCRAVDPEENCLGKDESPASTYGQDNVPKDGLPRVVPSQDDASKDGLPRVASSQDNVPKDGLPTVVPSQGDASKDGLPRVVPSQGDASKDGLPRVVPSQDNVPKDGLPRVVPSQDNVPKDGLSRVASSQDNVPKDGLPTVVPSQGDASKDGLPRVVPSQDNVPKDGLSRVASSQDHTSQDRLPTAPIQNDTSKDVLHTVVPSQDDASQDDFLEGLLEPMFNENVTDVRCHADSDGNAIGQDQLLGHGKKSSDDSKDYDKSGAKPKIKNTSTSLPSLPVISPTGDSTMNLIDLEDEKSDEEAGQSCSPSLLCNVKLSGTVEGMNVLMS